MLDSNRRRIYSSLLIIILFGVFLRFHMIGAKSLWMDEILALCNTVQLIDFYALPRGVILAPTPIMAENNATNDFHSIWVSRVWDTHPPLYFIALKVWIRWFGSSDTALRSLSAFFSILTIPLGFLIARRLAHGQAGLFLALALATSPIHVYYAQENRGYALLVFLILISFYYLLRVQNEPQKGYWLGYGLALAAAFYTHYFAGWILLAQGVYVVFQKNRGFIWGWLKGAILAGLIFLPWLPQLLAQRWVLEKAEWLIVDGTPWAHVLSAILLPVKLIFSKDLFSLGFETELNLWFSLKCVAMVLCMLLAKKNYPQAFYLLMGWVWVPIGVLLALDLHKSTSVLNYTRYTFMLTPALYLLLALALASLKKNYQSVILGIILIANLLIINHYYKESYKIADWKEAARYVKERVQSDDLFVIYNPGGKDWITNAWLLCLGRYFPFREHPFLLIEGSRVSNQTIANVNTFKRVALVAVPDAPLPSWLLNAYPVKEEAIFTGVGNVVVFSGRD